MGMNKAISSLVDFAFEKLQELPARDNICGLASASCGRASVETPVR
jgi:hypothetical protein